MGGMSEVDANDEEIAALRKKVVEMEEEAERLRALTEGVDGHEVSLPDQAIPPLDKAIPLPDKPRESNTVPAFVFAGAQTGC